MHGMLATIVGNHMTKPKFGFLYEPSNENEVKILFGLAMPYLSEAFEELGFKAFDYYLDEFSDGDPDCILVIDGKKVGTEFEFESYKFYEHGHDPKKCDLVVCWKHTWFNCPKNLMILELSQYLKRLRERGIHLIQKEEPKYSRRTVRWSIQEFMDKLRENVPIRDFLELKAFIDGTSQVQGVLLQTGIGKKIPTLGIGFKQQGEQFPLNIDATGRASIGYYNVNAKPPYPPQMNELAMQKIRDLLAEPNKQWHIIKASNANELVNKLKAIVKIMTET
jgi:hypothetical protein